MQTSALAYFLTWTTYGSWLPGDERGWLSRQTNGRGMNINPGSEAIQRYAASQMKGGEIIFAPEQRSVVEQAIEEVARYRAWQLIELSCRTNHVHALVTTSGSGPDKVMGDFKSYATRALRARGWFLDQQVWTKGGSKRYVNTRKALLAAVQYIKFQDHNEPDEAK